MLASFGIAIYADAQEFSIGVAIGVGDGLGVGDLAGTFSVSGGGSGIARVLPEDMAVEPGRVHAFVDHHVAVAPVRRGGAGYIPRARDHIGEGDGNFVHSAQRVKNNQKLLEISTVKFQNCTWFIFLGKK